MENKDMNIAINVKPYKVLLQSSEDGVTGGYYDTDEVWHEFGEGGVSTMGLTPVLESGEIVGLEESYNDVKEAVQSGKIVYGDFTTDSGTGIYYLGGYVDEDFLITMFTSNGYTFDFYGETADSPMVVD